MKRNLRQAYLFTNVPTKKTNKNSLGEFFHGLPVIFLMGKNAKIAYFFSSFKYLRNEKGFFYNLKKM